MADTKTKASDDLQMEIVPPAGGSNGTKKVELDLDDAPFLRKEEEEKKNTPPARPSSRPPATQEAVAPDGAAKKKKKLIIAGAALLIVLLGLIALWLFVLRTPEAPPPPPVEAPKPEIIVVPSKTVPPPPIEVLKPFEPFWVENRDAQGQSHFLNCSFSVVCEDPKIEKEIDRNMIVIRDAVYYYLRSKNFEQLMDADHAEEMKKDFANIVNNYLSEKKVKDVLYESFLAQ